MQTTFSVTDVIGVNHPGQWVINSPADDAILFVQVSTDVDQKVSFKNWTDSKINAINTSSKAGLELWPKRTLREPLQISMPLSASRWRDASTIGPALKNQTLPEWVWAITLFCASCTNQEANWAVARSWRMSDCSSLAQLSQQPRLCCSSTYVVRRITENPFVNNKASKEGVMEPNDMLPF